MKENRNRKATKIKTVVILIFILALNSTRIYAQDDNKNNFLNSLDYSISYYGNNLWNPGLSFNAEYIFYENVKTKVKQKRKGEKKKVRTHNFMLDGKIGFYWDPKSHVGAFNHYGISYLRTGTKGFQYKIGISPLSYYRSFLPETYKVDKNGDVDKVFLPGRNYYAPTLTLGIGKKRNKKRIDSWFLNLNIMTLMPYNTNVMPMLHLEYGYRINLKKTE